MLILGIEHLQALVEGRTHSAKMVFNAHSAIFFPATRQHRDKAEGISYEDNYKGSGDACAGRDRDSLPRGVQGC
jgi:hypothetical protein